MKINKVNYENFVIDYLEGSLSPDLKAEFDSFLQVNPKVYEEIKLYLSAPVLAEPNETVFAEKDLLKRRVISYRWLGSLAAAAAVLLIGSFFFFNGTDNSSNIASVQDKPKQELATEKPVKQKTIENTVQDIQQESIDTRNIADIEVKKAAIDKRNFEIAKPAKEIIKEKAPLQEMPFEANESLPSNQSQLASTATYRIEKERTNTPVQIIEEKRAPAIFANIETLEINKVNTTKNTHVIYVPSASYAFNEVQEVETTTKNNKIIDLFMTKAYDDVDLKEAVVANNLDRLNISKDKIREMLLPESILN